MSTDAPLPPSSEEEARQRGLRRGQLGWLAAMAALALGMIVDLFRNGRVHPALTLLALIVVATYAWRSARDARRATRTRARYRPRTGRGQKPMIGLVGALFFAIAIANVIVADGRTGPLWRVLVALAAFLYLWWLGSLLFDLVFVWNRYIQGDAAHRFLRESVQRKSFRPDHDAPEEPPPAVPVNHPPSAPTV